MLNYRIVSNKQHRPRYFIEKKFVFWWFRFNLPPMKSVNVDVPLSWPDGYLSRFQAEENLTTYIKQKTGRNSIF